MTGNTTLRILSTGIAIAIAKIVIFGSQTNASAQTVTAISTAHRNLIQAMLGTDPQDTRVITEHTTSSPPTPQSYLTKPDQDWVEWNLRLARDDVR